MNTYPQQSITPSDIEQMLTQITPQPDPAFANALEQQLIEHFHPFKKHLTPKAHLWTIRPLLTGAALLALLLLSLLATPYGKALAANLIELFHRADSNQRTITYEASSPAKETQLTQTIAEMEAQAGFDILEPASLPAGVFYQGGFYEAEHSIAWLDYGVFLLAQQPQKDFTNDQHMPLMIGPDTVVQPVSIGNLTGQYYQGAWISNGNPSIDKSGQKITDQLTWDNNIPTETLAWQQQDMVFILIIPGKDSPFSGLQNMADLAASLIPEADSDLPTPQPLGEPQTNQPNYFIRAEGDQINFTFERFDLQTAPTFEELTFEQLTANYQLPLPQHLPQGFQLKQAVHFPESNLISLQYMLDDERQRIFYLHYIPANAITTYLDQQAQEPTGPISASAVIREIPLDNGQQAEWVSGEWAWHNQTRNVHDIPQEGDQIQGQWDPEIPNYRLRWQQDTWLISLEHGGSGMWHLNQNELVNIANSLP